MRQRYGLPVGYSDHTLGMAAPLAAAALGATIIEKHFTFSRRMYGSDAAHSMEPDEFRNFGDALTQVSTMLAYPTDKDNVEELQEMKRVFEKSVVTARPVPAGTELRQGDLGFKKPGDGISAASYRSIIGRVAAHDLPADHKLEFADLR